MQAAEAARSRLRPPLKIRNRYRPLLLESFVEHARFKGTCYRAANWQHIGVTCGRGRQDGQRQHAVPVKDIYLYPLQRGWRERLCRSCKVLEVEESLRIGRK